jgi:hypothetical protein
MKALLLLLLLSFSAMGETIIEAGPTQVGIEHFSTGWMATMTERFWCRYDLTIGYVTEQEFVASKLYTWEIRPQIFVGAERSFGNRFRFGIGPYYFQNADRVVTTNFRIGLHLEYQLTPRFSIHARHFSNAGSGDEKTFCMVDGSCRTHNWNTGQDSLLRLGYSF